jgi:hypothetical protein
LPTPPVYTDTGPLNSGTGSVTYTLPSHQADDWLGLVIECGATAGITSPPAGWAHVDNSPRAQGSNVSTLNVLWKRATSSSETNPTVGTLNNHQVGYTILVRGVNWTSGPFDTGGEGVNSANNSNFTVTGGSTTTDNCLVVCVASSAADDTADQFGSFTNSSVTSLTKQANGGSTAGSGGSVDVITGVKASAGSVGTFTATQTTSTQFVGIIISLMPAEDSFTGWGIPV